MKKPIWMRMGMTVNIDEKLIKSMKKNEDREIVEKAVIEAIKSGEAWTNGASYFYDDEFMIFEFEVNMPPIQIVAHESFFYNPEENDEADHEF
jgi:hypothetical protein